MLNLAVAEQDCVDQGQFQWDRLSEYERRLIGRFRQMTDHERHQVRRLIEQLANNPDSDS
ncbi:hypothetical protein [Pseudomonas putida]|uniref:hypothetical protein n=1 Tax=Pseudomonas putida TaxID=303 RepID=UPI001C244882|nr:hypothetical protein [Pseudomonas putida]